MTPTPAIPIRISNHAIQRYIQRADPHASHLSARIALTQILSLGRISEKSRHWMKPYTYTTPGTRFVYWSGRPGIGLIISDDTVVTVFTRGACQRFHPHLRSVAAPVRRTTADERARRRWSMEDLEDAA